MTDPEEGDAKSPFEMLTRKAALIALLSGLPFFFLFLYFDEPGRARAAAGGVGIIVLAVQMRWDLRKRLWFWTTIAILVLLQALFILFIPWSNTNYPGVVLLPTALLDLVIVYGSIKVIEKLIGSGR